MPSDEVQDRFLGGSGDAATAEAVERLNISDLRFRLGHGAADPDARSIFPDYALMKTRAGVQAYRDRISAPQGIIELGVMRGGSCALFEALYQPLRHLAVDICRQENDGIDALVEYVAEKGRHLQVDFCTSQADPGRILDMWGEYGIDLIVDDASHDYDLTVAAFNGLFARLQPGGVYVIEDWAVSHWSIGNLTPIVADLTRACALSNDMVADISVTNDALFVTRGRSIMRQFAL